MWCQRCGVEIGPGDAWTLDVDLDGETLRTCGRCPGARWNRIAVGEWLTERYAKEGEATWQEIAAENERKRLRLERIRQHAERNAGTILAALATRYQWDGRE